MKLNKFLLKAKKDSYASGKKPNKLDDRCEEFFYTEKNLLYRDRYFRSNPFIGEEIVFNNGEAIWGMNYYGSAYDNVKTDDVYKFLQKALKNIEEEHPFRGPLNFREGDFKYVNKVNGSIKKFSGLELIFYKEREVYKLYYHGGLIK